jgi:hypothetical protein
MILVVRVHDRLLVLVIELHSTNQGIAVDWSSRRHCAGFFQDDLTDAECPSPRSRRRSCKSVFLSPRVGSNPTHVFNSSRRTPTSVSPSDDGIQISEIHRHQCSEAVMTQ